MKTFTQPMQGLKEFEDLEAALPKLSGVIQISGCIDALAMVLETESLLRFRNKKRRNWRRNTAFLIRTLPIIRQRIFCFTSRISGEMC